MQRGLQLKTAVGTTLSWVALVLLLPACDRGEDRIETKSEAARQAAPGRLLVLRFGGPRVEVIRSRSLSRAPRAPRVPLPGWKGRYEVQDRQGRVVARGRFRLERRRHALFGNVNGPAEAVEVPVRRPVTWLRVPTPAQATRVVLYDAARRRLGEVAL